MSPENMKNNTWVFDEMCAKLEDILRLYFQNVNGFVIDSEGGDFHDFCDVAKEIQADVVCAAEHNLDTSKYHIRSVLESTRSRVCPRSRLTTATSTTVSTGN